MQLWSAAELYFYAPCTTFIALSENKSFFKQDNVTSLKILSTLWGAPSKSLQILRSTFLIENQRNIFLFDLVWSWKLFLFMAEIVMTSFQSIKFFHSRYVQGILLNSFFYAKHLSKVYLDTKGFISHIIYT